MNGEVNNVSTFERLKYYLSHNWLDKVVLKQYVVLGKITSDEYKQLTGEEYVA